MSFNSAPTSGDLRTRLAHALGYNDYPANATAEPYLTYIYKCHVGAGALEEWLELFIEVVEYFDVDIKESNENGNGTIQGLIDRLAASGFLNLVVDTTAGQTARLMHVEDTVMYILGTWSTMLSSFVQQRNQSRKIVAAYRGCIDQAGTWTEPYDNDLAEIIQGCELLPNGRWDHRQKIGRDNAIEWIMKVLSGSPNASVSPMHMSLQSMYPQVSQASSCQLYEDIDAHESLSIKAIRLNAFTLNVFSAVRVTWTQNITRHLKLTRSGGQHTLELFSLPCAFNATTRECVGMPPELAQEVQESYSMLFSAWHIVPLHVKLGGEFGIRRVCWCWSCTAYRYRERCLMECRHSTGVDKQRSGVRKGVGQDGFDDLLVDLSRMPAQDDWTPDDFPHLWARIACLEQHLQTSRPWSLWVLFRDRRDTVQFWTFLFATVVVLLTIVQVLLGIAQVVGSFA